MLKKQIHFLYVLLIAILAFGCGIIIYRQYVVVKVKITSTPRASIFIDGAFRGLTPLEFTQAGSALHLLRLERTGYQPFSQALDFTIAKSVKIKLKALTNGKLKIGSQPAGALIYLNGIAQGRTPKFFRNLPLGEYNLKLLLVNYFPKQSKVNVAAGEDVSIELKLEHREVRAYYARLKYNKFDIAAYNDLGELLYVLGRFKEAAEVYGQGFVAAGEQRQWVKGDLHNINKLKFEPRRKHKDKKFLNFFNFALIKAVKAGNSGKILFDEFQKIPFARYKKECELALKFLLEKKADNDQVLIMVARVLRKMKLYKRRLEVLQQAADIKTADFSLQLAVINEMVVFLPLVQKNKTKKTFEKLLKRAKALPHNEQQTAKLIFASAKMAFGLQQAVEGHKLVVEAIALQSNKQLCNTWRLYRAEQFIKSRSYLQASILLHQVIEKSTKRHANYRKAYQLLRRMPKKFQAKPKPKPKPEKNMVVKQTVKQTAQPVKAKPAVKKPVMPVAKPVKKGIPTPEAKPKLNPKSKPKPKVKTTVPILKGYKIKHK